MWRRFDVSSKDISLGILLWVVREAVEPYVTQAWTTRISLVPRNLWGSGGIVAGLVIKASDCARALSVGFHSDPPRHVWGLSLSILAAF